MIRPQTSGVLVLLIDALRWDFVARTRFLRSLAAEGAAGRFQEPFGFTPRAAYFGGVDVEPDGFTHMFEWNPGESPFSAARHLASAASACPGLESRVRPTLDDLARGRVSPFAAKYISTSNIPLDALPYFTVAEQHAPWSADAHPGSLFGRLSADGQAACAVAWPDTNGLSDRAIAAHALATIAPEHRLAFVHLSALDGAGHTFGPGAPETQHVLEESDGLAQQLVAHCRRTWSQTKVVVFGDHGMVPVLRAVDVLSPLRATGLTFGEDLGYFVDSTGIRFWYLSDGARDVVHSLLDAADYGHFLTVEQQRRFGLDRCSWRNGHEMFVVDPGVVLSPNFFGSQPPLGMHGYNPACLDNQGGFLLWDSHNVGEPRDAGVVNARRLFPTLLRACGLAIPAFADRAVELEDCPPQRVGFTPSARDAHERLVAEDMAVVTGELRGAVPGCEAIVLLGSFGRGEGAVRDTPAVTAVNDYDVLVVGGSPTAASPQLKARLSSRCRVDALDLNIVPGGFTIPASQMGYDARYGARVLYGVPDLVSGWGCAAPGQLPNATAWVGISNRVCGLLDALPADEAPVDPLRLHRQLLKLGVAIGDAFLIAWRDYHHLAAIRASRFATLAPAALVPAPVQRTIIEAYRGKGTASGPPVGWCPSDAIAAAQAAVTAVANFTLTDATHPGTWFAQAGALASAGWTQQVRGLSNAQHDALSAVYTDAWPLFFAYGNEAASPSWFEAKAALTSRWLELVH